MDEQNLISQCVAEISSNGKYELAEQLQQAYDRLIGELAAASTPEPPAAGPTIQGKGEENPFGEHTHIPIAGGLGHVTWHGKQPPSPEMMQAFETLAKTVQDMPVKKVEGQEWVNEFQSKGDEVKGVTGRLPMVCICGSTRFADYHAIARWLFEQDGKAICTMINYLPQEYAKAEFGEGKNDHFGEATGRKEILDDLHKRKIDISDAVFVVDIDGYIGESTKSEIDYAVSKNIPVYKWTECEPSFVIKQFPAIPQPHANKKGE